MAPTTRYVNPITIPDPNPKPETEQEPRDWKQEAIPWQPPVREVQANPRRPTPEARYPKNDTRNPIPNYETSDGGAGGTLDPEP